MKRTRSLVGGLLLGALIVGCAGSGTMRGPSSSLAIHSRPPLTIIYPRPANGDTLLAPGDSVVIMGKLPDSLFAFGSVNDPSAQVTVNGVEARMHANGAWIAWAPATKPETRAVIQELEGPGQRTIVTIRRDAGSNGETAERRVQLVAPIEIIEPWELPRRSTAAVLRVTANNAKIRIGWPGTTDLYPDSGTVFRAVQTSGAGDSLLWKLALPGGEDFWIENEYVEVVESEDLRGLQVVHKAVAKVEGRWTRIHVPLGARVPARVERVSDTQLELTLYGAVSWTDIIVQPEESRVVDEIRWSQPDSALFRLTAWIDPNWFWGWETGWVNDTTFVWSIRQSPDLSLGLQDLVVVVDPGHGGENISAIGPTGSWESRMNLPLGMAIARELRRAGADVRMTGREDVNVGLLERISFAREVEADLLISVHHNGLPQGKNPFSHHGVSLHYVHRHAKPLADALYAELTTDGRPGAGIRYQDLAVARPSWLPSVLLESGFLMHPEEEQWIRTPQYRVIVAKGVRRGIERYISVLRARQNQQ